MKNYKAYDARLPEPLIKLCQFKKIEVKAITKDQISKYNDNDFANIFDLVKGAKSIGEASLVEIDEDRPFLDWFAKSTKWKALIDEVSIKNFGYGDLPLSFQGALYGEDENGNMLMAIFPNEYENTHAGKGCCPIKFELIATDELLDQFDIKI